VPDEAGHQLHFHVGSGGMGRTGHYETPGYEKRWEGEKAALDAERIRLLYVAATRARDHLIVPHIEGKGKPGPFMRALEPLLPEEHGHEIAADGAWLLAADELPPAPEIEEAPSGEVEPEVVARAIDEREGWIGEHDELIRAARRELAITVASSVERSVRPLAAEASHSASTLLVSEGPPLPIGDALHLVMERVALPGAEDLDEVVETICAEAGLPDDAGLVGEMARRCLDSDAIAHALASAEWYREVPFTVSRNGGFGTGRVDLIYREGDELVVVDFKTDHVSGDPAAHEAFTLEHHSGQAEVYSEALAVASGLSVRMVVFVYCRTGVEVTVLSSDE
jgi:ATP-dependent exoDNAse (exonuclease V) beta subunit